MKRDAAIHQLRAHRQDLESFGINFLALFGSVARDEASHDSDLDILVGFEGRITFDRYMDLKFYLEDLLNTPVDLMTHKMLRAEIKDAVEQEAIRVA
jgi:predicted nucleotidyltransferase